MQGRGPRNARGHRVRGVQTRDLVVMSKLARYNPRADPSGYFQEVKDVQNIAEFHEQLLRGPPRQSNKHHSRLNPNEETYGGRTH